MPDLDWRAAAAGGGGEWSVASTKFRAEDLLAQFKAGVTEMAKGKVRRVVELPRMGL